MRGKVLIVAALFLLSLLGTESAGAETTVTIWHSIGPSELRPFEDLVEEFMIDNPDINIVLEQKADMENVLKVTIPAGTGPDLFIWAHDWTGKMSEGGLLTPIDNFVTKELMDKFTESARDAFRYNGHYYGVPYTAETTALIYNKKLVPKAPESFDDMEKVMKAFKSRGLYGIATNPIEPYYLSAWMHAFGGFLFNDTSKKSGLGMPQTIKGTKFFYERVYPYMAQTDDYNAQVSVFRDGRAPYIIDGPWSIPETKAAGIDVGVAPIPYINEGGKTYYPQPYSGIKGIYMTKNVRVAKAAWRFMEWFSTSDYVSKTLAMRNGYIPILKSAVEDPQIKNDPVLYGFARALEHAVPMPNSPEMGGVWDPARRAALDIMSGKLNAESALKKADQEIKST
jgi:arabinogalactan oligomer/maltooligosaccharide transport system substrate-binding protein